MGDLAEWGKSNNRYITIEDGKYYEGVFQGARVTQSTFDPEKDTIQYKLDGKLFNCASRKLAIMMDTIPIGTKVRINRDGQGNKTKYTVQVV